MAKVKISPKTGLIMSKVTFGIKGKVENSSINVKNGKGKGDRPYSFADFPIDSFGHKLKIKVGGSRMDKLNGYDFDKKESVKVDYVKNYSNPKINIFGVEYTTMVDGGEDTDGELCEKSGVKCDFDFATDIKEIITSDKYEMSGEIDFRRYKDKDGAMKVTKELKLKEVEICKGSDDEEMHHFGIQNFLFTEMVDKKFAQGFILSYNEVISVRFEVDNEEGLADTLANKKLVKPFTLMSVLGVISNKAETVKVEGAEVKGNWGKANTSYTMAKSFAFMKMVITEVDPSTLNHGALTEKMIMEAIQKTNEIEDQYNSPTKNANWGGKKEKAPKIKEAKEETVIEEEEVVEKKTKKKKEVVVEDEEDEDFFDFDD